VETVRSLILILSALPLWGQTPSSVLPPRPGMAGEFELHKGFASKFLSTPRDIIVYLPPGYRTSQEKYPVLYMHDGQNLFDPATGFAGQEWRLDETVQEAIAAGGVPPLLIVGIYNTGGRRTAEYTSGMGDKPPDYARLLVEELKPFVEARYRTLPGPENAGLGGSSLGALVSLAVAFRYPGVFGKLAILSPSVWWGDRVILRELAKFDASQRPRIWLDIGTAEGNNPRKTVEDTRALRDALIEKGWKSGIDLQYLEAEGAAHNEHAWSQRAGKVLEFLFGAAKPAK
jgi:predicted alpha/beta superfamily hydrolase